MSAFSGRTCEACGWDELARHVGGPCVVCGSDRFAETRRPPAGSAELRLRALEALGAVRELREAGRAPWHEQRWARTLERSLLFVLLLGWVVGLAAMLFTGCARVHVPEFDGGVIRGWEACSRAALVRDADGLSPFCPWDVWELCDGARVDELLSRVPSLTSAEAAELLAREGPAACAPEYDGGRP